MASLLNNSFLIAPLPHPLTRVETKRFVFAYLQFVFFLSFRRYLAIHFYSVDQIKNALNFRENIFVVFQSLAPPHYVYVALRPPSKKPSASYLKQAGAVYLVIFNFVM